MPEALLAAVEDGKVEEVDRLIAADAGIKFANKKGHTALILASVHGHDQIATSLIQANADLNLADKRGNTALICACKKGHGQIATSIIQANAEVNAANHTGTTALIMACKNGHGQIVANLLQANADANVEASEGYTALAYAAMAGRGTIATSLIMANVDVNVADRDGSTALIVASYQGHEEVAATLIAANADVNAAGSDTYTALIMATMQGHDQIALLLMDANADVNYAGGNDVLPVDYALSKGNWQLAHTIFALPTNTTMPRDPSLLITMIEHCYPPTAGDDGTIDPDPIFKAAVAKDTAANAKLTDSLRPGELFLVKLWNAVAAANRQLPDPYWTTFQQASQLYQQHDITAAANQTGVLEKLCEKHAGGKGNQARYAATHDDIKMNPSYKSKYLPKIQGLSKRVAAKQGGAKPVQTTPSFEQLYANCHAIKPRFDNFMYKICEMAQNKAILPAVLKSPFRSLQKAAKAAGDALACKDIVRGIAEMADLGKGNILLDLFMGCDAEEAKHNDGGDSSTAGVDEKIVIVWFKDRWSKPTNGGWSDSLLNFYFANDETKTICELQLPHGDMMAIREAFGAHNGYDELRKAAELLAITGHADIVARIEIGAAAKEAESLGSLGGAKGGGMVGGASGGGVGEGLVAVSGAAFQQCLDAIQTLTTTTAALQAENAALRAKVQQLDNEVFGGNGDGTQRQWSGGLSRELAPLPSILPFP